MLPTRISQPAKQYIFPPVRAWHDFMVQTLHTVCHLSLRLTHLIWLHVLFINPLKLKFFMTFCSKMLHLVIASDHLHIIIACQAQFLLQPGSHMEKYLCDIRMSQQWLGITVSWDVVLCRLQVSSTLMKEVAGSSEKLVHIYQTAMSHPRSW